MSGPTVFISYSHQDKDLLGPLVAQLKALEQAGLLDVWVDTRIDAGEKWYQDIEEAMQRAAVAVCLVSEHFLASDFCAKHEVPFLLRRAEQDGLLIIPVLLSDCPWYAHRWVEERQMIPGEGHSVRTHYANNPAGVYSKVARRIHDKINDPNYRLPTGRLKWTPLASGNIDIAHLPETGAALFGRDETLTLLDKVWEAQSPDSRVVAFKAQGGVGKSTLINQWLVEMRRDNFRGATRVFGWSFYSQGVRDQGAPSADTFIAAGLRFFGDDETAASAASPWDKGQRLARLVGAERALLILDGMEPLQSAHPVDRGKLRDPALEALLRGLARQSAGLCIITTRETLADLGKKSGIVEHDLEQITSQAGRALLRAMHVVGTDAELESLAGRFGPHALAISLLGTYLHKQPGSRVGPATELEQMSGRTPVDRVLAGFEKWFGQSAELEALRLLGFFDRPADECCLEALRTTPPIPGLTELLAGTAAADWVRVLAHLETLRLIHTRHGDTGKQFVDTHPIIREHFAAQLREGNPVAWREGHRRLYEYLCESTKEGDQPTLEDLQPLYQAVAHGCQAGLHQEACDKVFFARLRRSNENYANQNLGAFGSDLGAVASFFESPWKRLSPNLTEADRGWCLAVTAFDLRALGRLTEALEPLRESAEEAVKREDWRNAAIGNGNLSELELTLGEVAGALDDAERSVTYSDAGADAARRQRSLTKLAYALHQAGRTVDSLAHLQQAEKMQLELQPRFPQLSALEGYRFCGVLLARAEHTAWRLVLRLEVSPNFPRPPQAGTFALADLHKSCAEVQRRAAQSLSWSGIAYQAILLSPALDHLTLGRAALYAAILENAESGKRSANWENTRRELDAAVSGLRRAGTQDHLPRGLLTRAWLRFLTEAHTGVESAQEDLDEAWEIAERGPMRLFMADIHLYRARLFHAVKPYPWNKFEDGREGRGPKDDLADARELIERCGYWRRKEELEDAEEAAKVWE
jgi:TIR domain-containing protein